MEVGLIKKLDRSIGRTENLNRQNWIVIIFESNGNTEYSTGASAGEIKLWG